MLCNEKCSTAEVGTVTGHDAGPDQGIMIAELVSSYLPEKL